MKRLLHDTQFAQSCMAADALSHAKQFNATTLLSCGHSCHKLLFTKTAAKGTSDIEIYWCTVQMQSLHLSMLQVLKASMQPQLSDGDCSTERT